MLGDPARLHQLSVNALANAHLIDIEDAAEKHIALYRGLLR